jgi:hypothetical protein
MKKGQHGTSLCVGDYCSFAMRRLHGAGFSPAKPVGLESDHVGIIGDVRYGVQSGEEQSCQLGGSNGFYLTTETVCVQLRPSIVTRQK